MSLYPKVVCLMPTLGRFQVAQRSVAFFEAQTYPNKELLIFNQSPVPMSIDEYEYTHYSPSPSGAYKSHVTIVNSPNTYPTLGAVYNDALEFCHGDLINIWDDDNGAFPWFLEETISHKVKKAAKSARSWCWSGGKLTLGANVLEPSIVMDMDVIKKLHFEDKPSLIHQQWYYWLVNQNELQLIPDPEPGTLVQSDNGSTFVLEGPYMARSEMVPGFVYCWGVEGCWHISCDSDQDRSFKTFQEKSKDFGESQNGVLHHVNIIPWYDMVTKQHPELRLRLGLHD